MAHAGEKLVLKWLSIGFLIIVFHAETGRADDQEQFTSEETTPLNLVFNWVSGFSIIEGCLCESICKPAQVKATPACTNSSCRRELPLNCENIIESPAPTKSPERVEILPVEIEQHMILRDEFERFNASPPPSEQGKSADGAPSEFTNKPPVTDAVSLRTVPIFPQPYSPILFAHRVVGPDPQAVVALSQDYKIVYFPCLCASIQRKSLAFDFDNVLGRLFGPDKVSPIFNGSKLAVTKCDGGLRFSLMLAL
jgi:hypothetical protein